MFYLIEADGFELNEEVFERTFHESYERIYNLLFRLVGNRTEAEDLTLETFWKLWKVPPDSNENLAGWLYRVATRLGFNALRSRKRRLRYEKEAGELAINQQEPEINRLHQRERIRKILVQLPRRSVEMLILRYSGLSYKEIASALGIAAASVGTLLIRAEKQFETLYREGDKHASERSDDSRVYR